MEQLGLRVIPAFCSEAEEASLMREVEERLAPQKFQEAHWDGVISERYRETEVMQWKEEQSAAVIQRMSSLVSGVDLWRPAHVLELPEKSQLGPHVDSERICGDYVIGLSLLTDSVMRLAREGDEGEAYKILLERRSLYVLGGESRHKFTHSIEEEHQSFEGRPVAKGRRVSVMLRDW